MTRPWLIVVDDEPEMGEFVCNVATKHGFQAVNATHATEFVTQYRDDSRVIILDLFMPDIDGIELIRFLGRRKSNASIILMSGVDKSVLYSAQELALELGLHLLGTMSKPFRKDELVSLLEQSQQRPDGQLLLDDSAKHEITEDELYQALHNEEMIVHYQPQIEISTNKLVGAEALIRWNHPTRGITPPAYFLPLAENTNLINDITDFVLDSSIKQCRRWNDAGMPMDVSVNISPRTISDYAFPEKLLAMSNRYRIEPKNLVLEITETSAISDLSKSLDILTRIRMKGFKLAIDDFGTGHSSLEKLARIPFTELKIDRSFIRHLGKDPVSNTIAKLSIMLAHEMEMSIVAEGVETLASWKSLHELGCDRAQGFWVGHPMPAEDFSSWLLEWESRCGELA